MMAGFDVTVVTSGVQYMTGEDIRPGRGWCPEETIEGIRILRAWAPRHHRHSLFRRIINYLSYSLLAGIASLFRVGRVDRIFACTDPIFMMPILYIVSLLKRAPLVLDERDLYPETAIALGVVKEGLLTRLLLKMQHFYRRKACSVLAATPGIRSKLISYGNPEEKVQLLYNADTFLDEDIAQNIDRSLREETGKEFLVGYVGGLGKANNVLTLLQAATHLRGINDLGIIIIGSGEMFATYKEFCRDHGLKNVYINNAVPRHEARNLMNQMDICVQPLPTHQHFAHTLTSKTFDYHGVGKPTIFCGQGDTEKLLVKSGGGVTVPPGDDRALAEAIRQMRNDESMRRRMGVSARKWFEQHIGVAASCTIMKKAMNFEGSA